VGVVSLDGGRLTPPAALLGKPHHSSTPKNRGERWFFFVLVRIRVIGTMKREILKSQVAVPRGPTTPAVLLIQFQKYFNTKKREEEERFIF
jgi:hypothetical protein